MNPTMHQIALYVKSPLDRVLARKLRRKFAPPRGCFRDEFHRLPDDFVTCASHPLVSYPLGQSYAGY